MDTLTDEEVNFINRQRGLCPFCKEGQLIGGPRGGDSQNFRCDSCDQEFNLYINRHDFTTFIIGGEQMDRDEPDLYYGLPLWKRWGTVSNSQTWR